MTVAFNDVVQLTDLLSKPLSTLSEDQPLEWDAVSDILAKWYRERVGHAATINILSVALYDLFGADGKHFIC